MRQQNVKLITSNKYRQMCRFSRKSVSRATAPDCRSSLEQFTKCDIGRTVFPEKERSCIRRYGPPFFASVPYVAGGACASSMQHCWAANRAQPEKAACAHRARRWGKRIIRVHTGRRVGKASPLPTLRTGEIYKIYPIKTKRYFMLDEKQLARDHRQCGRDASNDQAPPGAPGNPRESIARGGARQRTGTLRTGSVARSRRAGRSDAHPHRSVEPASNRGRRRYRAVRHSRPARGPRRPARGWSG